MTMRITGLSSGMDVDSIVKQLMSAQQNRLNSLNAKKTTMEWQRDQYRDIASKLVDFRNNKLFNYNMQSTMAAMAATVSGSSAAQASVSVKASSSATTGSMSIQVNDLAAAAQTQVKTASADGVIQGNGTFTITDVNNNSIGISVNAGETLADVATRINTSGAQVNAYYDSASKTMSLTSKVTGAGTAASHTITVSGTYTDAGGTPIAGQIVQNGTAVEGKDADVVINGISTKRSTNTFTENGVEITLNAKSDGTAATITTKVNTDAIVDKIKSYLTDYNSVLSTLTSKVNEDRNRDYGPLTADQKKDMSDDDIKMWNTKAQSGLLHNDSTLSALVSNMRLSSLSAVKVDGQQLKANGTNPNYKDTVTLGDLGIDSGSWSSLGQLSVTDESKLRAAIEKDPDAVMRVFMQQSTSTDPKVKNTPSDATSGIFNRLSSTVMSALTDLSSRVGTSSYSADVNASFLATSQFGDTLRGLDTDISDENDRLTRLEDSYYKKFTAMETAISKFQSQASSLGFS